MHLTSLTKKDNTLVTGDLAKGCIEIANQELCDVCKMLIRDELTRKLDRYNGTKLKRMYKLTNQDMLQTG